MTYIDLHTHTTASDGTLTPKELVNRAKNLGLGAVAITDHDTIDGVKEALEEGNRIGIEVVPGVEISADFKKEMHILGYFINIESPELITSLKQLKEFREERNPMIINKLKELGFDISLKEIEDEAGGNIVGRPHIAKVLLKKGYVNSMQEAFDDYLATGKPAYFKKERLLPEEAIQVIKQAGGLPVLAHPKYLGLNQMELEELISRLKKFGLVGVEAYYSEHTEEETDLFLQIAEKFELVVTGGSDFHGSNKPEIELGKGLGALRIDKELLDRMKER